MVGAWPSATDETSATTHRCGSTDCTVSVSDGQAGGCPFVQTSLLGGVFRVDHFQLVVETFQVSNGNTVVICPYLQFAATDLLQLCGKPQRKLSPSLSPVSVSSRLPEMETVGKQESVADVNHNGSTPQVSCQNDSCADMFASFLGSPASQAPVVPNVATVDRCRCSVSQLFAVDYCENISLRSRHVEQLSLQFTATGYFVGPPKLSSCGCLQSAGNPVPPRLPMRRPVVVMLGSRSVRWYPVLHIGCIYRLITTSGDVSPFFGKFTLPRTKKTKLERHAVGSLIVLDANVDVERMIISTQRYQDLMLSADEEAALLSALDDVRERLKHSDEFWQQHCLAASAR